MALTTQPGADLDPLPVGVDRDAGGGALGVATDGDHRGPVGDGGTVTGGRAGHGEAQPGVVGGRVVVDVGAGQLLGGHRRQVGEGGILPEPLVAATDAPAPGEVVHPQRRPERPGDLAVHHAVVREHRDEERQQVHEVWGVAAEALALVERFVDQPHLTLLEVAQAAMDQFGALRGGAGGEVVAFDERGAQAAGRRVQGDTRTGDPAADDDDVERLGRQPIEHGRPIERRVGVLAHHGSDATGRRSPGSPSHAAVVRPVQTEASCGHASDHVRSPGRCPNSRSARRTRTSVEVTVTYDPHGPAYLDEKDTRDELTRVFDVCHGCRRCVNLCSSFPSLFEMIDRHDDHDAGRLTPAEQDRVVDECFHCKLCYVNCPYVPGQHELAIDFPRLMLRTLAMRETQGQVGVRDRLTTSVMGRTDLLGKAATRVAPAANRVAGAKPGSLLRRVVQVTTGVSAKRLLAPFARTRFTTWFKRRPKLRVPGGGFRAAVFPTCLVEYQAPEIGHDLVKVYERNGVECSLADTTRCCGAPLLHNGDIERFTEVADDNVAELAATVRSGRDIVVPQPTCSYVLKKDYVDYCSPKRTADAELVALHTFDAAEYLMRVHQAVGLDTSFPGEVPATITYHTPCHLRAQDIGLKSRDLMKLTGARVKLVQQCSGIDGMWGLRAENADLSLTVGRKLADGDRARRR